MVHELDEFAELLLRALIADVRDVGEVLQGLLLIGSFHGYIDGNQAGIIKTSSGIFQHSKI